MTTPYPFPFNLPYAYDEADGSTTVFNFGFPLLTATDLTVWVTLPGEDYDPVGDIVSNYTVHINPDNSGGYITFDTAPVAQAVIIMRMVMAIDNPTAFSTVEAITGPNLDKTFLRESFLFRQIALVYLTGLHYPENTPDLDDYSKTEVPLLPDGYIWQGFNGRIIKVKPEENPDASTLRTELASEVNGADGSRMVGYYCNDSGIAPVGGLTVNAMLTALADKISGIQAEPIGTIKMFALTLPSDYLLLNDTTLGSTGSGAFYTGADYEVLFSMLWGAYDNSYLTIYDDNGIPVARGASASADWSANKRLSLPKVMARSPVGAYASEQVPSIQNFTITSGTEDILPVQPVGDATERYQPGQPVKFITYGTLPSPLNTSDVFYVTPISDTVLRVADTPSNSSLGIYLTLTGGTGDSYIQIVRDKGRLAGSNAGSDSFVQAGESVGVHTHDVTVDDGNKLVRAVVYGSGSLGAIDNDNTVPLKVNLLANNNALTSLMSNNPLNFSIKFGMKYK